MENKLAFKDFFDKNFIGLSSNLEKFTSLDIVLNISVTFIIGMLIYAIYKHSFQGVLYQKSYAISIVLVSCLTTLIIMTISGNLILSLGMVGALSIVRFRTPIKDPIDLAFIFWALTVGIANGVGYFKISIIGSIMVSIFVLFLTRKDDMDYSYLLVIHYDGEVAEKNFLDILDEHVKRKKLKSTTINSEYSENIYEVKLTKDSTKLVKAISDVSGVTRATLVSYSSDLANV